MRSPYTKFTMCLSFLHNEIISLALILSTDGITRMWLSKLVFWSFCYFVIFDILYFDIFLTNTYISEKIINLSTVLLYILLSLFLILIQLSSLWFNLRECVVKIAIFLFKSFQRFLITCGIKLTLIILVELIFFLDQLDKSVCPASRLTPTLSCMEKISWRLFTTVVPVSISKVSKNLRHKVQGHVTYWYHHSTLFSLMQLYHHDFIYMNLVSSTHNSPGSTSFDLYWR